MNLPPVASRIAAPAQLKRHAEAVRWVNSLVLDLKLQLLGRRPHDPITFERLDEWHKLHAPDLLACVDPAVFKHYH